MNSIRVLLYKSFARWFRNRTALGLTFLVPIAMIYIFGWVFGLNSKQSGPRHIPLAVVNESDHPAAEKLVQALRAETAFRVVTEFIGADKSRRPLREADARAMIRERQLHFALVLPADLIAARGVGLHLKILSDPVNQIETQTVNGILQKTIFSNVPELLVVALQTGATNRIGQERMDTFNDAIASAAAQAFGLDKDEVRKRIEQGDFGLSRGQSPASGESSRSNDLFSRLVNIEAEQVVGREVRSPEATRVVGGWALMMLMFALNGAATSLFEERKAGIFYRLLAGPVTRAHIIWSRFLFGIAVGLVQLITIFSAGQILFGIDVFGHFGNLVVISIVAAAACTALGMFIASISDTPESAMGLATLVILAMSAIGGAWFPISFMPPVIQQLAKFTLTYWAMDGFSQVLWAGNTLLQLLPTVVILVAITGGLMAVAIWRFNRGRLFE
jgi:ABC-2 type transport system permease protein